MQITRGMIALFAVALLCSVAGPAAQAEQVQVISSNTTKHKVGDKITLPLRDEKKLVGSEQIRVLNPDTGTTRLIKGIIDSTAMHPQAAVPYGGMRNDNTPKN